MIYGANLKKQKQKKNYCFTVSISIHQLARADKIRLFRQQSPDNK